MSVAMLAQSVTAFQAPAMMASTKAVSASMFAEGDIGVTPPLGVYDPLGLIATKDMRRFEIMEIKHGRAAMLGFRRPGYLSIELGARSAPAQLRPSLRPPAASLRSRARCSASRALTGARRARRSPSADLKFNEMPVGCFASLEATPTLGWLQIMALTCASETGYAGRAAGLVAQTDDKVRPRRGARGAAPARLRHTPPLRPSASHAARCVHA
jgi:light-harvesting complex I chlorophyll a/b binding protein 1